MMRAIISLEDRISPLHGRRVGAARVVAGIPRRARAKVPRGRLRTDWGKGCFSSPPLRQEVVVWCSRGESETAALAGWRVAEHQIQGVQKDSGNYIQFKVGRCQW